MLLFALLVRDEGLAAMLMACGAIKTAVHTKGLSLVQAGRSMSCSMLLAKQAADMYADTDITVYGANAFQLLK